MLLQFKVKNFRSIKDEIIFDLQATSDKTMAKDAVFGQGKASLLKSAVIYGPNASGKSNILKAFVVFRMMILESLLRSNLAADLPSQFFKLSAKTEDKPSFFEMTFIIEGEIFVYGFEIDKKRVVSEWLKQEKGNKTLFRRFKQEIASNKNYFKEASKALEKQVHENVLFLSVLSANNGPISRKIIEFFRNTNFIPGTKRGATLNYTFGEFLNNSKMTEKIKNFMADIVSVEDIEASQKMVSAEEVKIMPDKFKDALFDASSQIAQRSMKFIYKKYGKKGKIIKKEALDFFAEESEGTQQIFALSAPIIDTLENGKVLLIDEIDASLHPMLCRYIVSIFNSKEKNPKNAQLIFTTHDISLLNDEFFRRDQIYFTDKNKQGATELFSLADISERKGINFAKRYLEGRYGALPYISDFEKLRFFKQSENK